MLNWVTESQTYTWLHESNVNAGLSDTEIIFGMDFSKEWGHASGCANRMVLVMNFLNACVQTNICAGGTTFTCHWHVYSIWLAPAESGSYS